METINNELLQQAIEQCDGCMGETQVEPEDAAAWKVVRAALAQRAGSGESEPVGKVLAVWLRHGEAVISLSDPAALSAGQHLYAAPPSQPDSERLAQLREWLAATGALPKGSSWIGELEQIVVGAGERAQQPDSERDMWTFDGMHGAKSDMEQDSERDAALEVAATVAIKETAIPRDMLGAPSPQRKAIVDVGLRIAAKIRARKGGA